MKVINKQSYLYFPADHEEMKPAEDDVFYQENGLTYSQFYKGQLIPIEIWNEVFGKSDKPFLKVEEEIEKNDLVDENVKNDEKSFKNDETDKTPKKRFKSIIKKK